MLTLHYTSNSGMNAQGHGWLHPDAAQQGGFALSSQCWPEQHKFARAGRYGPAPPPLARHGQRQMKTGCLFSRSSQTCLFFASLFCFCFSCYLQHIASVLPSVVCITKLTVYHSVFWNFSTKSFHKKAKLRNFTISLSHVHMGEKGCLD